MPPASIPDPVRRFVLGNIPSVPYLEAILLLRADPASPWDAQLTAERLYLRAQVARELLNQLAAAGVVVPEAQAPGSFRYRPMSPELASMLDDVAAAYASDLIGVTELIHSRIDKRAQQFADAFRWRKDP